VELSETAFVALDAFFAERFTAFSISVLATRFTSTYRALHTTKTEKSLPLLSQVVLFVKSTNLSSTGATITHITDHSS